MKGIIHGERTPSHSSYTTIPTTAHAFLRERPTAMPVWNLPIENIRLDGGTQAREAISTLTVDGFHRVDVAKQAGVSEL